MTADEAAKLYQDYQSGHSPARTQAIAGKLVNVGVPALLSEIKRLEALVTELEVAMAELARREG